MWFDDHADGPADTTSDMEPTTERLRLRRLTVADLDPLFRIHSDPMTNRFNPVAPMSALSDARTRLDRWIGHWRTYGFGYWAVARTADPSTIIGFAGLSRSAWCGQEMVNLYYRFTPSVWGHGYATEAAQAAVAVWQAHLTAKPLVAYTTADNLPSRRTASAAGLIRRPDLDADDGSGPVVVYALGWP